MPVLENIHVQLAEVLEVRGEPLRECEVWAVLHLTLDTIQDLFLRGTAFKDGVPEFLPTPETLQCTSSGRIQISSEAVDKISRVYWSPELASNDLEDSEDDLGKVYVFALAKTIRYALENDPDFPTQPVWYSPFLIHTLELMEQEDPKIRTTLTDLSKICTQFLGKDFGEVTSLVLQLHQEVLGSLSEADILEQVDMDFRVENDRISFSVADEDKHKFSGPEVLFNLNQMDCSYGHRLEFRDKLWSSSCQPSKPDARERWKQAFALITLNRKQQKLNNLNVSRSSLLDGYSLQPSISKVYQELAERRRMVELLRMNIDLGTSAVKVNSKGLKPKTLAELVLLLKNNPTKAEPTNLSADPSL